MMDVIIATYDRPKQLQKCLEALGRQTVFDFNVVVVDNCSRTSVSSYLEPAQYTFPLQLLRTESNSGPAHARNEGVTAGTSDLILFIDDDVVADRELIQRHLEAHDRSTGPAVVIGPLAAPEDWNSTPWTRWEAETIAAEYRRMTAGEYQPTWRQFFTGNASLPRDSFERAGGFNVSFLRAEDIEFAYRLHRLGCTFAFDPKAIGWHYSSRTLQSWRQIPRLYAWSDHALDHMYPELRWRQVLGNERSRRHTATRAADRCLGAIGGRRLGASSAIGGARMASRLGMSRLSSGLLSVAYELEYSDSAAQLEGGRAFNTASTATG